MGAEFYKLRRIGSKLVRADEKLLRGHRYLHNNDPDAYTASSCDCPGNNPCWDFFGDVPLGTTFRNAIVTVSGIDYSNAIGSCHADEFSSRKILSLSDPNGVFEVPIVWHPIQNRARIDYAYGSVTFAVYETNGCTGPFVEETKQYLIFWLCDIASFTISMTGGITGDFLVFTNFITNGLYPRRWRTYDSIITDPAARFRSGTVTLESVDPILHGHCLPDDEGNYP